MIDAINKFSSNILIFRVGVIWTVAITILLIVLFFVKSSRDERGRAIIGKASIISTIVFIILINFFAKISYSIEINYLTVANCIQYIYNIVLTIEVIAILIYKKLE